MANLPISMKVYGADFPTTCAEYQRDNTEISLKTGSELGISNGDILKTSCASSAGYTTSGTAFTVTTDGSLDVFSYNVASAAGFSSSYARRTVTPNSSRNVISSRFKFVTLPDPTIDSNNWAGYRIAFPFTTNKRFDIRIFHDGIYSAHTTPLAPLVKIYSKTFATGQYYNFGLDISTSGETVDVYIDGVKVVDAYEKYSSGTYTSGDFFVGAEANGSYAIQCYSDDILVGSDFDVVYPTECIISLPQVDSGSNATVWDMSSFSMATNPNGESGTIKFKYAQEDTGGDARAYGEIYSVAINSGGTGYAVDDVLTVVQSTNDTATLTVTSVSSGVITGVSITTGGGSYTTATGLSVTGGTGSDATFDITVDNSQYNGTWLTLAETQAETDLTTGIARLACQITGKGTQDGTITDANIIATITGEYSYTF